ncbi:MAG: hypothetical protein ABSH01_14115 [Terriglobia bacterium]|jgi:hypothetical protein
MRLPERARVESEAVHDLAQVMKVDDLLAPPSSAGERPRAGRLNFDVTDTKTGALLAGRKSTPAACGFPGEMKDGDDERS